MPSKIATSQKTFRAKSQACCREPWRKYPLNKGIKEAPSDPSAVMRLTREGMRKARISESAAGEVPSSKAHLAGLVSTQKHD